MFSSKTLLFALVYFTASSLAAPTKIYRREVPQEHSHEPTLTSVRSSLNKNNPLGIVDPVFGLLGNAAAQKGLGKLTDPDCLQQATADQAFTNAKAAGDVQGMVEALTYRALERNTGSVGATSNKCTSIQAVNPQIAAIQQHQDPASTNAASVNKAIVLALAQQIASVGGNPQDALKSGTFAPGKIGDPTAKGNTCDDANDPNGCIFTQNLLVPDATAAEINAAVAGVSSSNTPGSAAIGSAAAGSAASGSAASGSAAAGSAGSCAATVTVTVPASAATATAAASSAVTVIAAASSAVTATAVASSAVTATAAASSAVTATAATSSAAVASSVASSSSASSASSAASGQNLQTFTGALGGATAPAVTKGGRGFVVAGQSSDFVNIAAALGRSCDVQHNACANIANSASGKSSGLTVGQCDTQDTQCKAATGH